MPRRPYEPPSPPQPECVEHCGHPGVVTCHRCHERICSRCAATHRDGPTCRVLTAAAHAEWRSLGRAGIYRREGGEA